MGLLDKIKADVKKSGSNKGKFVYVREGAKVRIRFLQDMDEGLEVKFHDNFERGINCPCQEQYGRNCPYCDEDSEVRTRSLYAWSVYNYETNQVEVLMYAVNNCTPIPAFMAMYENYGTLTDRDYVISVSGKMQNKTFSVVPMDKVKFRNEKAKALSEKKILSMIDKAWPCDDSSDDDDDYDDEQIKKKKSKTKAKEADADDWDADDEETSYEDMSAKELYKLCKDRDLEAKPKKPAKYYIEILKEADAANDDWDDEDDEDEWEDE